MRFRTKLFLVWALLILLLCAAGGWSVYYTIAAEFDHTLFNGFTGTRQSLRAQQESETTRLRQECALAINTPDLRALIADSRTELSPDKIASLEQHLDSLSDVSGVPAIFILDSRGRAIAQNAAAPWPNLPTLRDYLAGTVQSRAFLQHLFRAAPAAPAVPTLPEPRISEAPAETGLWNIGSRLYHIVGLPLAFQSKPDGAARDIQGALIMATPLTNELAGQIADQHNCVVSFLIGNDIVASSLPRDLRNSFNANLRGIDLAIHTKSRGFDLSIHSITYRSSFEPLIDPASNSQVGGILIQSSLAEFAAVQTSLWRILAAITLAGLAVAAIASFILSHNISRSVRSLLRSVQRVAAGDLAVSLSSEIVCTGELAELSRAFTDMVDHIRTRREQERRADETNSASEAKSQFIAKISREIRAPLDGILNMTDLLQKTPLSDQQKQHVSHLQSSASRLLSMINDILDFSKIEAGNLELETISFDLRHTIQAIIEQLKPKADARQLFLRAEFSPEIATHFRADPKRIQQIIMNLINNAIQFTDSGGIIIRVSPAPTSAAPAALAPIRTSLICFEVIDTGSGIPPERIGRLFQTFSPIDTGIRGGTGLGLAVCKQLAELMGGQIGVSSILGKGSTFWFTLQLRTKPTAPSELPAPAKTPLPQLPAPKPPSAPAPIASPAAPTSVTGPINLEKLRQQYAQSPHVIPTLLERFEKQAATQSAALNSALANAETETLTRIAHTIKGSAGYLAAERLAQLAAAVESAGQSKNLGLLAKGISDLQLEINACLLQIPIIRRVAPAEA